MAHPAKKALKAERSTERAARGALHDKRGEYAARVGLASRGFVYLVVAALTIGVALGSTHEADRQGALRLLVEQPMGAVLVLVLCAGIAAHVGWQLLRFAVSRGDLKRRKDLTRRLRALGVAAVYLGFMVSGIELLLDRNQPPPQEAQVAWTARILSWPGGRWILGAAGLVVVIGGIALGVNALRLHFQRPLDLKKISPRLRQATAILGVTGRMTRGVIFVLIGGFLVRSAIVNAASESKGFDATLRSVRAAPLGPWLLLVAAAGLAAFGIYSFIETRCRRDLSL